jgi:hypothetical protein
MTIGELKALIKDYSDESEFLIFPEIEGEDEEGNTLTQPWGVGCWDGTELYYLDEVGLVNVCDDEEMEKAGGN